MAKPTTGNGINHDTAGPDTVCRRDLPLKLSHLRQKLGQKAKKEPRFRFYSLYGHIANRETLNAAWKLVCDRKKAPGVDGVTFRAIEKSEGGVEGFIETLLDDLRRAWDVVAVSNHHDFITGTSPDRVWRREQRPWLIEAQLRADRVLGALATTSSEDDEETPSPKAPQWTLEAGRLRVLPPEDEAQLVKK